MKFDKNHKVIVSSLTEKEAIDFIFFLLEEELRHQECILDANMRALKRPRMAQIYANAAVRHNKDIDGIEETIRKVMKRFDL